MTKGIQLIESCEMKVGSSISRCLVSSDATAGVIKTKGSDMFLRVKYNRHLYRIRNSRYHITKQAIVDLATAR